jgi:hypothetical protein
MLTNSYEIVQALHSDLPLRVRDNLESTDNNEREHASWVFIQFSKVPLGKRYITENGIIKELAALFNDPIERIRHNAYEALIYLSEQREGCESVARVGIIEILVDKLITEKSEKVIIQTLILIKQLLYAEKGPEMALGTPIISRVKKLLDYLSSELKRLSAEVLAAISFSYPGKLRVIDQGCIGPLADLLSDDMAEVRGASLLALASLTIEKTAKVELIEGKYIRKIMELLKDDSQENRLNAVQLISNVAEHPAAKIEFQNCLDVLRDLLDNDDEIVKRFADKAINIITWKP